MSRRCCQPCTGQGGEWTRAPNCQSLVAQQGRGGIRSPSAGPISTSDRRWSSSGPVVLDPITPMRAKPKPSRYSAVGRGHDALQSRAAVRERISEIAGRGEGQRGRSGGSGVATAKQLSRSRLGQGTPDQSPGSCPSLQPADPGFALSTTQHHSPLLSLQLNLTRLQICLCKCNQLD